VFLAAKTLPTQLGADKNTSWGAIMIDQFSEAVKSARVIEALANELRQSVCNAVAQLFPEGSKLKRFFAPGAAATAAAAATAPSEEPEIAPTPTPESPPEPEEEPEDEKKN
jgi:hypothetical protein